jgi:hypothetical protein
MYGCVCVSLVDGGDVGSQGRTGGVDGVGSVPLVVRPCFPLAVV